MLKWDRTLRKAAAWALAAVLFGTSPDIGTLGTFPVYAASEAKEVILSFGDLPDGIEEQKAAPGTEESELEFPDILAVTLSAGKAAEEISATPADASRKGAASKASSSSAEWLDEDGKLMDGELLNDVNPEREAELTNVRWRLVKERSSAEVLPAGIAGDSFLYEPVIPKGYILADDAALPRIHVVIEEAAEAAAPAFEMQETLDGVTVTVTAEEGTFPESAKLVVEKVPAAIEEEAEAAVAEKREEGRNVAVSYTFDICVKDKAGNELQPAEGKQVKVSFAAAEAADRNLEADIYHITEEDGKAGENSLTAEKLETEMDKSEGTVTAETDGFSLFSVVFNYEDKTYSVTMQEGQTQTLSSILNNINLYGTVSVVTVSDSTLFSVYKADEVQWVFKVLKSFDTPEWMDVTISGIVYRINVTGRSLWKDYQETLRWGFDVMLTDNLTAYPSDTCLLIPSDKNVVLDLNGHTINRNLDSSVTDGCVIYVKGTLTIKDTAGGGKITGGYSDRGGGILVYGGKLILEGGTISGNNATEYGGGVYVISNGEFTMNGGTISGNNANDTGGGVFVANNSKFTMNGGTISGNESNGTGGGIYALCDPLSINGGSIINNKAAYYGGGIRFAYNCNIQGDVSITGNKCSTIDNNLYIPEGKTVTVTGALTGSDSSIGIKTQVLPTNDSPVVFASADPVTSPWLNTNVFKSDDETYMVGRITTGPLALIKRKRVTVTDITASNKTYDGTETATLNFGTAVFNGMDSGDELTLTAGTGTFSDANAGNGKTVNITGLVLGGADAGKYKLTSTSAATTANITPKEVGLTWSDTSFTYNGSTHKPTATLKTADLIGSDTCTVTVTGERKDAGTGTATAQLSNSNYTPLSSEATRDFTINKAPLSVKTESAEKVYDGTALTAGGEITGLKAGETATLKTTGSQTEAGSSTNTYELVWDGTAKKENYVVDSETLGTLKVTEYAGEITVTTTGGSYTYDGTAHEASVAVGTLPAGYSPDTAKCSTTLTDVTTAPVTVTADQLVIKNASGVDVTDKLNIKYVDGTLEVTPAKLDITTKDAEKVYDGTALTADGEITGFAAGETATIRTTGSQTDAGNSNNTYELVWDGTAKESNYELAGETLGTLTVTAKEVSVPSGITAKNKNYDGNTNAALDTTEAVISGKVDGDQVTVKGTGTFEKKTPGNMLIVFISGLTLTGSDAGNYTLTSSGNQTETTASILALSGSGDSSDSRSSDTPGRWNQNGDTWTYSFGDGSLAKGWNYLVYHGKGDWVFFDQNGIMQDGWLDWNGSRYYLFPISDGWRGRMLTGWQLIDGIWYYFEPVSGLNQGHMYRNETTPDGYRVNENGAWIR